MRVAITGFPKSGKTTVFNALTGQEAPVSAFSTGRAQVHQAVVRVPDARLDRIARLFKPKKTTPATVEYLDLAGLPRTAEVSAGSEALGEKQMTEVARSDALLAVVRGFRNAAGEPPDPAADVEAIALEMALADLKIVEGRIERIEKHFVHAPTAEKPALGLELETLRLVGAALEQGRPARALELDPQQEKTIRGFQLLTLKPTMFLVNDEDDAGEGADAPVELGPLADIPGVMGARLRGRLEMEIARLPEQDRAEFMADYGLEEPAARRVIALCHRLLGRISFFTVSPEECRAWTLQRGATALAAAGTVHSDMERGFIRAEVIGWEEMLEMGSLAEAKRKGRLRVEGRDYVVQDGEIIHVLFSV